LEGCRAAASDTLWGKSLCRGLRGAMIDIPLEILAELRCPRSLEHSE